MKNSTGAAAGSGALYSLGIFGAWVYFWQQADGFWEYALAIRGLIKTGAIVRKNLHGLPRVRRPPRVTRVPSRTAWEPDRAMSSGSALPSWRGALDDEQGGEGAGFLVAGGTPLEVAVHGGVQVVRVGEQCFDVGVHPREAVVTRKPRGGVEQEGGDGVVIQRRGRC